MANKKLNPVHPGEVLLEEFLKPFEMSQNDFDLDITEDRLRDRLEREVHVFAMAN